MQGVTFDTKFVMGTAACELAAQAHNRLNTILRARRFYPVGMMMWLYKSLVLSFVEVSTPALYHATPFALSPVDRVQERFLLEMELSEGDALRLFALAPLAARRDIAMLGLIHRVVLGLAPSQFRAFIRPAQAAAIPRGLRAPDLRHYRQLHDPIDGTQTSMFQRSLLRLIYAYNLLPQHAVDYTNVKSFQRSLQRALKTCLETGVEDWSSLFTLGVRNFSVGRFQSFFVAGVARPRDLP